MMTYLNDKYSIVLDTEDTTSLTNTLDGEYKGIGISMVRYENSYIVVEVFDNTPASKSGIKPGDKIIKIDGDPIDDNFDYNEYRNKLIKQDTVSLTIDRDNNTFNTVVDVKDVEIPIVYSELFNKNNKNIGYIYLKTFNDNSYKQFKSELEKLEEKGIDSLIIDVRSNGGGLLDKCTNILELFIKEGKTLYGLTTKSETTLVKSTSNVDRKYPVVVLINEKSASASEVLAGAMKESYGATLIGKKSYGKGKVQQTASLSKNNMIKYTVANWTTPSGNSIDGVGINPGISVDLDKKYAEDPSIENDNQIQKAIEFLSER
jgi:carboxyl-terminal processing protease